MNKRDAAKLRKQRLAQIDQAFAVRIAGRLDDESTLYREPDGRLRSVSALYRERNHQIELAQKEYIRNLGRASAERRLGIKKTREKSTSRFWRHFGQDGQPVPPWETEAGPHVESIFGEDDDHGLFAEGDYGYEDFDTDWGGYDYVDTGYDDENA